MLTKKWSGRFEEEFTADSDRSRVRTSHLEENNGGSVTPAAILVNRDHAPQEIAASSASLGIETPSRFPDEFAIAEEPQLLDAHPLTGVTVLIG